jgi:hypothetical protein
LNRLKDDPTIKVTSKPLLDGNVLRHEINSLIDEPGRSDAFKEQGAILLQLMDVARTKNTEEGIEKNKQFVAANTSIRKAWGSSFESFRYILN